MLCKLQIFPLDIKVQQFSHAPVLFLFAFFIARLSHFHMKHKMKFPANRFRAWGESGRKSELTRSQWTMCLLTVIIATVLHSVIASLIIYPLLLFPSCFQVQHICTANRRVITKLQRSQSAAERKKSFVRLFTNDSDFIKITKTFLDYFTLFMPW